MIKVTRIFLIFALLAGQIVASFAVGPTSRKKNAKVALNIRPAANFNSSLNFNLRNGLRYTGSLTAVPATTMGSFNTLVTYTKGNSVYILPYKQKILVADMGRGYTGTKLIIRPR